MIQKTPLEQVWQTLVQKTDANKITIFKDIPSFHAYKQEYVIPYMVAISCQRGIAHLSIDNHPLTILPNSITLIQPGHLVRVEDSSADYSMSAIVISTELYDAWRRVSGNQFIRFAQAPTFVATEDQNRRIWEAARMMETVSELKYPEHDEDLINLIKISLTIISTYSQTQAPKPLRKLNHNEEIFMRFNDLLMEHYTEARDIKYYADVLCISPKYFSSIILKGTGITALDWITSHVIVHAKLLLKHHREMSIQDICYQLGFTEQAAFSRYFKRATNMTPSQYRGM